MGGSRRAGVVLNGWFSELEAELLGMIAGGEYEGLACRPTGRMRWCGDWLSCC